VFFNAKQLVLFAPVGVGLADSLAASYKEVLPGKTDGWVDTTFVVLRLRGSHWTIS
jgi:hypothetical protein